MIFEIKKLFKKLFFSTQRLQEFFILQSQSKSFKHSNGNSKDTYTYKRIRTLFIAFTQIE